MDFGEEEDNNLFPGLWFPARLEKGMNENFYPLGSTLPFFLLIFWGILQFQEFTMYISIFEDVSAIEPFQVKSIDWLFEFLSFSGGELIGTESKNISDNIQT